MIWTSLCSIDCRWGKHRFRVRKIALSVYNIYVASQQEEYSALPSGQIVLMRCKSVVRMKTDNIPTTSRSFQSPSKAGRITKDTIFWYEEENSDWLTGSVWSPLGNVLRWSPSLGFRFRNKCSDDLGEITHPRYESACESHGTVDSQCTILFHWKSLSKVDAHTSPRSASLPSLSSSDVLKDVEYQILDDYFEMLISNQACKLDLISKSEPAIGWFMFELLSSLSTRHAENVHRTYSSS